MGKPTGFIEYSRQLPANRMPLDRINDWQEFRLSLSEEELRIQGARCMDCGIPFCHMGAVIGGMASGCPLNNLIPEWNDLVYHGLWEEALARLLKTNNFPEFTGRVCPALCEGSCTSGLNGEPVTIKNIEYSIIEKAYEQGLVTPQPPTIRTGKTVAVVGSGPSGLAAADQLNKAGHSVTVYERADRVGGLLMYGIPNMKLGKNIIERRVNIMKQEGITFLTNTEVGKNIPATKLLADYDAVILAGGATKPRDLAVEGRDLKGIHFAVEFLHANTKSLLDSKLNDNNVISVFNENNYISAKDKDVIIIGGGDTGTDCVGTSIRHHCKSVIQLEIMPEPSIQRTANNQWPQYPKTYKLDYGQEESKELYGEDPRKYCHMTKKFVGDGNGHIKEVHVVEVDWQKDENGRFIPVEREGSLKVLPAQLVLLAMGFVGPEDTILDELRIERDSRSNVKTQTDKYATNINGVFTAGDMHRGQSLVVLAINEGRRAAAECDQYLASI